MKILLMISASLATLAIAGIVIVYLLLGLPQGILVANWGMGAIAITWVFAAIGAFFLAVNE